jgi:AcrR family transcriptional regulator
MEPRRTRTNNPQALRRRVIDATAALFQARGYHATSTQDVMREAGVTAGALHHHFPTKKALALAVIEESVAGAVDETWVAPVVRARSTARGVRDVLECIADGLDERGRVQGCPVNNLALELSFGDRDFQRAIHAIFERWREAIAKKVRADRAAGRFTKGRPDAVAAFVVASYSGAMALAKASQSAEPLRICARHLAEYFAERSARRTRTSRPRRRRPLGRRRRRHHVRG